MVKYLGSKRLLAPALQRLGENLPVASICDVFAGTTRAGQAFRRAGLHVRSNDLASYSEAFGRAYIEADDSLDRAALRELLAELDALPGEPGYFTETFCKDSRFFQPHNGERIDAIRTAIDRLQAPEPLRGVLLTSLLEAADRVDSTCGLQMAYLKQWSKRSGAELELREPQPLPGPAGSVSRLDAGELVRGLGSFDCAYIDPPYNQHSYFANYHIWETLVRWDHPQHYGVACKRVDCRTNKSDYNSRVRAWDALSALIERLPTPWLIVSCNDEGFHDPRKLAALISERRHLRVLGFDFKRYVGAQIGIHDPRGRRVGRVSHLHNTELLFIAGPDAPALRHAALQLTGPGCRELDLRGGRARAGGATPAGIAPLR